jgi:hypothetical protein
MRTLPFSPLVLACCAFATALFGAGKDITALKDVAPPRPYQNVLLLFTNVAHGESVTVGSDVFQVDTNAWPTAALTNGAFRVALTNGALAPTNFGAAFVTCFNSSNRLGLIATAVSRAEVLVYSPPGVVGRVFTCTNSMAVTSNLWARGTLSGGSAPYPSLCIRSRTVSASEVLVGQVRFQLGFTPVSIFATVWSSAGVTKAWDGALTLSGALLTLDNSGSTDWAATDIITVFASE